jgi:hypothetical protein
MRILLDECVPSNQLSDLAPMVPYVLTALSTVKPGDVIEVRA